jgi:hypothetical protein
MKTNIYILIIIIFTLFGCNKNIVLNQDKVVYKDRNIMVSHQIFIYNLDNKSRLDMNPINKKIIDNNYFFPKFLFEESYNIEKIYISGRYEEYINVNEKLYDILLEMKNFENLKEIKITKADISYIPSSIGHINNLQTLDLRGNKINDISEDIKYLKKLEDVDLESNDLGRLSVKDLNHLLLKLSLLKNLKRLVISSNFLDSIPENIKYLRNLEHLIISYNYFKHFPCIVTELPNLKSLSIDYIEDLFLLPDCIDNLPKGITINLMVHDQDNYNREQVQLLIDRYPNIYWSAP